MSARVARSSRSSPSFIVAFLLYSTPFSAFAQLSNKRLSPLFQPSPSEEINVSHVDSNKQHIIVSLSPSSKGVAFAACSLSTSFTVFDLRSKKRLSPPTVSLPTDGRRASPPLSCGSGGEKGSPTSSNLFCEAIPRTDPGTKLWLNVSSINPTHHENVHFVALVLYNTMCLCSNFRNANSESCEPSARFIVFLLSRTEETSGHGVPAGQTTPGQGGQG